MDWGPERADATDFVCVNLVTPVDIGESEDFLSDEELDLVQGYMDRPLHDRVTQ